MIHSDIPVANADALALLHRLQHHPALLGRLETLLGIVENTDGNAFTADEAEALVAQELRRLGPAALQEWAAGRQEGIESRHAARPHYQRKEKKLVVADTLWGYQRKRTNLAQRTQRV